MQILIHLIQINFFHTVWVSIRYSTDFFDMDLDNSNSYPPYNISKLDDNNYIIEMALAGFNKDKIELELANGELTVKSKKKNNAEKDINVIHQGISLRSFVRKFTLSDEIIVKNAEMKDGMLTIKLEKLFQRKQKTKINFY